MKFEDEDPSVVSETGSKGVDRSQGAARAISVSLCSVCLRSCPRIYQIQSFIDPGLSWRDIPWFKSITKSKL